MKIMTCKACKWGDKLVFQNNEYACRKEKYIRAFSGDHICHREDDFVHKQKREEKC